MVNVLLADDHPVFREGVRQVLTSTLEKVKVDEASNGQEVLNLVWANPYDVVFLDISMPGRNGLEILQQLKKAKPEIHVIILSMYSEEQYAVRAMKAGASGYLTKDGDANELLVAMEKVLAGRMHFSTSVVEQLVQELKKDSEKPAHDLLSDREFQVMRMIAAGKKLTDIASDLEISLSTVSTHRLRILKKMNMKSNADIIRYTIEHGLVE